MLPHSLTRLLLMLPIVLALGGCASDSTSRLQTTQGIQITSVLTTTDETAELINLRAWKFHATLLGPSEREQVTYHVSLRSPGQTDEERFSFGQTLTNENDHTTLFTFYPLYNKNLDSNQLALIGQVNNLRKLSSMDDPCISGCTFKWFNPAQLQSDGTFLLAEYRYGEKLLTAPADALLILSLTAEP